MARSLQQIKAEIKSQIRTYPTLDPFLLPEEGGSQVSIFNLFVTIVSASILVFEKIHDIFKEDLEALAAKAVSGNSAWLRQQILNFQYGNTVTLDASFTPVYLNPDPSKQIITRCAIVDGTPVTIKVAKGVAPALTALTAGEISALTDYYYGTQFQEGIGFAGITIQVVSQPPDRMEVEVDVYYSGQLVPAEVKQGVIDAIDNYFASFQEANFNGTVFIIKLTDAIQAVPGVTRIEYTAINARPYDTVYASTTAVDFQGYYATDAGYLISEDESGHTLVDSITLIAET